MLFVISGACYDGLIVMLLPSFIDGLEWSPEVDMGSGIG